MLRCTRGLSQNEIAAGLGISRSTYWAIEHGERPLTLYQALTCCDLLHVRFNDLYDPQLANRLLSR